MNPFLEELIKRVHNDEPFCIYESFRNRDIIMF